MNENARRGIQVSIDEVFDHFQELDVDASGKVSKRELERYLAGDDIQHTFIVVFDTADAGITWDDGANLSVVIAAIEPGSPASDNPDVVVGLAIASVNGSALPPGGAHMFKKAWRAVQGEPQLSVESNPVYYNAIHYYVALTRFYEPYIIVHDFAYTLDLEIDTSRKKNNKLTKTAASTSILRERWSHFWFGLHAWINTAISSGEHIESHHRRQQLLIVTAKIGNRAYAFVSDVVEALGDALFFVAPQHFKLESAVRADGKLGIIYIQSDRSPFRLLATDGPTCDTSLHRHLGFGNIPNTTHAYSIVNKVRESMSLGFTSSHEVRTFTSELLLEYDRNQNSLMGV